MWRKYSLGAGDSCFLAVGECCLSFTLANVYCHSGFFHLQFCEYLTSLASAHILSGESVWLLSSHIGMIIVSMRSVLLSYLGRTIFASIIKHFHIWSCGILYLGFF